eukprot:c3696_g1_i1.p1 GENE.c3696_g1_i1~~c3696_g1_i1.p1  ORF type:complete len:214 (+),score=22.00 c3696_g1_i1:39-644(+)
MSWERLCVVVVFNTVILLTMAAASFSFKHKFTQVKGSCWKNFVNPDVEGSSFCCHSMTDAPCYPGMNQMGIIVSFWGAWILPLTPSFLHLLFGRLSTTSFSPVTTKRRIMLYVFIFIFRTLVLYKLPDSFEVYPKTCWYEKDRPSGKCQSVFDISDHIILFIVCESISQTPPHSHFTSPTSPLSFNIFLKMSLCVCVSTCE